VTDCLNVLYTERGVIYEISISLSSSFHQPKQKFEKQVVKCSANININRQCLKEEMWLCLTDLQQIDLNVFETQWDVVYETRNLTSAGSRNFFSLHISRPVLKPT
jgi:hypothetical protein